MGGEPETGDGTWPALGGEGANVYEVIFREMEDAVFLVDVERTDGGYEFVFRRNNAAHRRRTGLSEDELRGQTPRELLGDEQGAAVAANYRRCVERGEPIEYEETLELPGGRSDWQTKLTPVTTDGRVTQLVGVGRDITERKAQQRSFERTARRFETVLETMTAAAFLKDTDGEYRLMNRACRDLLGVEEDAVDGVTDEDLFPPETAERTQADDRRVVEGGERIEVEETIPTTEGRRVRLTRKAPVYGDDGEVTAVCGVSTDITAQKRREEELRRLTERFELAVEGANIGVWDWDMTTDAVEFNENWARMLGHSLDEIDPHLDAWESRVHPDDIGAARDAVESHIAGESDYYETEHRLRTADGDWKWIRDVGEVVERDADGVPVRAVGIHLDIDDRKQYERTLERQRDSLEVLNQIVRHDVRNALQFVLEYGEMLDDHVEGVGETYRRQIVEAGREAIGITRSAGDVTRVLLRSETCRGPVALRPVLEEQIADVRASNERAVVSVEGALPDVSVLADDMLESVFRNVLTNAVVHNDEDVPEVTVSARADEETVRVRIADDGPGIPDDQKEGIFREGEKGLESEGSGLGLYLVRTLVERYGGDVRVEDNDPKGSVFVVELRRDD